MPFTLKIRLVSMWLAFVLGGILYCKSSNAQESLPQGLLDKCKIKRETFKKAKSSIDFYEADIQGPCADAIKEGDAVCGQDPSDEDLKQPAENLGGIDGAAGAQKKLYEVGRNRYAEAKRTCGEKKQNEKGKCDQFKAELLAAQLKNRADGEAKKQAIRAKYDADHSYTTYPQDQNAVAQAVEVEDRKFGRRLDSLKTAQKDAEDAASVAEECDSGYERIYADAAARSEAEQNLVAKDEAGSDKGVDKVTKESVKTTAKASITGLESNGSITKATAGALGTSLKVLSGVGVGVAIANGDTYSAVAGAASLATGGVPAAVITGAYIVTVPTPTSMCAGLLGPVASYSNGCGQYTTFSAKSVSSTIQILSGP